MTAVNMYTRGNTIRLPYWADGATFTITHPPGFDPDDRDRMLGITDPNETEDFWVDDEWELVRPAGDNFSHLSPTITVHTNWGDLQATLIHDPTAPGIVGYLTGELQHGDRTYRFDRVPVAVNPAGHTIAVNYRQIRAEPGNGHAPESAANQVLHALNAAAAATGFSDRVTATTEHAAATVTVIRQQLAADNARLEAARTELAAAERAAQGTLLDLDLAEQAATNPATPE